MDSQIAELTSAVASAGATCDVVKELGISGTDFEGRAGLQAIAARAREAHPNFSWVLVWKLSRFGRNMEEGLVYRALLRKRGIDLLSLKEPIPEGPARQPHHVHPHGGRRVLRRHEDVRDEAAERALRGSAP